MTLLLTSNEIEAIYLKSDILSKHQVKISIYNSFSTKVTQT